MTTQSEAALENGLIKTLQNMSYEFVEIREESNMLANFKTQLEKHNSYFARSLSDHFLRQLRFVLSYYLSL